MSTPTDTSKDSNVAFNKSLLLYSNNTENVRSWLSSSLKAHNGTTSVENEQQEEPEIVGEEEEGGLGYVAPVNSLPLDRQSLSANEKLRKQLMGNRASTSRVKGRPGIQHQDGLPTSKPKPYVKRPALSDSDDEVDGRTSTAGKGSSKRSGSKIFSPSIESPQDVTSKSNNKKRSTNYLDEILAQRKNKKSKGQTNAQSKPT